MHKIICNGPNPPDRGTRLDLITDNKGDSYSVAKNLAKSWETAAILSDLAVTAHRSKTQYSAKHRHREYNTWADALTNGDFTDFDPRRRARVSITTPDWLLANQLLALQGAQHHGVRKAPAPHGPRLSLTL